MSDQPSFNPKPLTGQRLRSLAFALLAKREYSKHDLAEKLSIAGASSEDIERLLVELATSHYQSDERMAGMLVRSQVRQGRGPQRIRQALQKHHIENELAQDELDSIDWFQQALALKYKKFGVEIAQDPKQKAKQIRFLQYRGFAMDVILKVIRFKAEDG